MVDTERVEALFAGALERPVQERAAFLDESCGSNFELRQRVGRLLECFHTPEDPLERPAVVLYRQGARAEPIAADDLTGQRIGPYRVMRRLASGGMGTVWLAERDDEQFIKSVAVKLIKRGMDTDDILQRFRTERQVLANLEHANIARLLDGGATDDGRPYLIMEYVDGLPIDRFCDERRFAIRDRLHLFRQVCSAIQYAHQNLVVHRDLKPSNILITANGTPKLLDFGIAKLLRAGDGQVTTQNAGLRALTPEYASPEQVRGEPVTTATDIYSLGVLLYRLLTGRPPYDVGTGSWPEYQRAICDTEPRKPSTAVLRARATVEKPPARQAPRPSDQEAARLGRVLAGDLDTILLTALRKEPQRRYASVEQFAEDIRRHLEDLPVIARPDTRRYRAGKFIRRNRTSVVIATTLLVLILAFGITSATLAWRLAAQQRALAQALALQQEAREAADVNAAEARQQAERHKTVADLLQETIASAHSASDGGEAASARQMLDHAAQRLDGGELSAQPEVEVAMRLTVGQAYWNLGDDARAADQIARGLLQSLQVFGHDHETTATLLIYKGQLAQRAERPADAEAIYSEALAIAETLNGAERELAGRVLNLLGILYREQGRFADSEITLRRALAIRAELKGHDSHDVGITLRNLSYTLAKLQRFEEAHETIQAAVGVLERVDGPDSVPAIYAAGYIPRIYALQKRSDEAVAGTRELVARLEQVAGADSFSVATMNDRLATLLHSLGRDEEALTAATGSLNILRERFAQSHFQIAAELQLCGEIDAALGRHSEAEAVLREALQMFQSFGDAHPARVSGTAKSLARALRALGRADEADQIEQSLSSEH
ncbi:MAG TPA: serine/threonine-protein kinase [Phycisphaerae bacterium]|jgi:serine/threonine-protein kinase